MLHVVLLLFPGRVT